MGGEALVRERILAGAAQIWPGVRSVLVTQLTEDGRVTAFGAGGSMSELLDMLPFVEGFARAQGCRVIEIKGRTGWRRVLSRFGFRFDGSDAMVKDL